MKLVALFLSLVVSTTASAASTITEHYSGTLASNNEACSITIETDEYGIETMSYQHGEDTFSFDNVHLAKRPITKRFGLYKKTKNNEYSSIIGAPIFALGSYYTVELEFIDDSIHFSKSKKVAYILNWVTVSTKKDICLGLK